VADSYKIGQERPGDGAATLLQISGELDINARDDLRATIVAALAVGDVVVDLNEVTFIDSEALGALIDGFNESRRVGAGLRLVNAHGIVERVLTVSGALELFDS
jgi:anti-sigma B factor antagonist